MPSLVTPESNASQLYNALIMPTVSKWLGDRGYVMADFDGGRNIADVMRDQVFQRDLHEAMHGAAQADRPAEERLMRGFATLGGVKWTPDLARAAQNASGAIAAIAPYVQAAAPDVWDSLHGSSGSVASLTAGIAEANKHFVGPTDAHALATGIFKELYENGDHHTTRGFSSREMGQIYAALVKRGRISPHATASQMAKALSKHVGPLSAVRDSMQLQTRAEPKLDDIFAAYDAMPREAFNGDPAELESQIRTGLVNSRAGGLFSTSAIAEGGIPDSQNLPDLEAKDQALRQQAATSPIGNMVAATNRLNKEFGFPNSSPAAQMMAQLQAGQLPVTTFREWQQIMAASGVPEETLRQVISTPSANLPYLTPELVNAVRQGQAGTDIERFSTKFTRGLLSKGPMAEKLQPLVRDQAAIAAGYTGADEMQALHGQAAQAAAGHLARARGEAANASQLSGLGNAGFVQRMSDTVQQATPDTSIKDLMGSAFNVVPQSKLPKLPKMGSDVPFDGDGGYTVAAGERCCHCGALFERGDDGDCNSCGKRFDVEKTAHKHFNAVCDKCGTTFARCRCMSPDKVTLHGICAKCSGTGRDKIDFLRPATDDDPIKTAEALLLLIETET